GLPETRWGGPLPSGLPTADGRGASRSARHLSPNPSPASGQGSRVLADASAPTSSARPAGAARVWLVPVDNTIYERPGAATSRGDSPVADARPSLNAGRLESVSPVFPALGIDPRCQRVMA